MRPVKDLYKPASRPGTQRKGKPERMTGHPERASVCLGCKKLRCNGNCKEYYNRIGRGRDEV